MAVGVLMLGGCGWFTDDTESKSPAETDQSAPARLTDAQVALCEVVDLWPEAGVDLSLTELLETSDDENWLEVISAGIALTVRSAEVERTGPYALGLEAIGRRYREASPRGDGGMDPLDLDPTSQETESAAAADEFLGEDRCPRA